MSANRLTVACCMRASVGVPAAVVRGVEAPRPLHRAGAEHERAAGVPVQRQLVGGGARSDRSSRSPAAPARWSPSWSTGGSGRPAGAVVEVVVPLVAQRAVGQRRPSCPAARVATLVLRQKRILPSAAGTVDRGRGAVVDHEDRAGQRVLRAAAVGRRAEARIAPGAGPRRRSGSIFALACVSL